MSDRQNLMDLIGDYCHQVEDGKGCCTYEECKRHREECYGMFVEYLIKNGVRTGPCAVPLFKVRLTSDNPDSNYGTLVNYCRSNENNDVVLSYAKGRQDVDLCEHVSELAKKFGCPCNRDDILDGACIECDSECEIAPLYFAAVQAAELRNVLKAYEDREGINETV